MKLALPAVHLSVLANFVSLAAALPKVLIFSRTLGYRHESIPDAISSLKSHGSAANIEFDATEDPTLFTNSNLKGYDAVLFLMTTDSADTPRKEVLTGDQKVRRIERTFVRLLHQPTNFVDVVSRPHSRSTSLLEETISVYMRRLIR